jgi:hypothetical protein
MFSCVPTSLIMNNFSNILCIPTLVQNNLGGATNGGNGGGISGSIQPGGVMRGLLVLSDLGMGPQSRFVDLGAGLGG